MIVGFLNLQIAKQLFYEYAKVTLITGSNLLIVFKTYILENKTNNEQTKKGTEDYVLTIAYWKAGKFLKLEEFQTSEKFVLFYFSGNNE